MDKVLCPYCGAEAEQIDSREYYKGGPYYGMMLICRKCDATVGIDKFGKPKGSLASKELRNLRITCHNLIDPLWRIGKISRNEAYRRVAKVMGLKIKQAHIGLFREGDCKKLIDLFKQGKVHDGHADPG